MNDDSWWVLDAAPGVLVWARLRERNDGMCEVLDSTGLVMRFPDELHARMHLLDLAYRAYDGLDDDDAFELGFTLNEIAPPEADDERELVLRMTHRVGGDA